MLVAPEARPEGRNAIGTFHPGLTRLQLANMTHAILSAAGDELYGTCREGW